MSRRELVVTQGRREKAEEVRRIRIKRRNVVLLAVGMFLANVAFGMAFPYLSLYMRLLGGGMLMVGLLSVAFNLTSTVFQYPFGYFSDRTHNRKAFISFGFFSTGAIYALMAFVSTPIAPLVLRTVQRGLRLGHDACSLSSDSRAIHEGRLSLWALRLD